ncbi:MAG: hypothetical protein GXO30_07380 [Epsilonproteobacteria bacterium]|nr:hypothetical protein [Campylobacterota bacterium]
MYNNQYTIDTSANRVANISDENSTTDLAKEFPKQMIAQRAIEADVVSIKTQDEILGTLLDIKV